MTKTAWELSSSAGTLVLQQSAHLLKIIEDYQPNTIVNYNNFPLWKKHATTNDNTCDLLLYAHNEWKTLIDILKDIQNIKATFIFLAINKYMLLPFTIDCTLPEDYNLAIKMELNRLLLTYEIIEYKYQDSERGDVGNAIIPDNRFLLKCVD